MCIVNGIYEPTNKTEGGHHLEQFVANVISIFPCKWHLFLSQDLNFTHVTQHLHSTKLFVAQHFLFECLGGSTSENSLLRPAMLTHSNFMVLMINILYQCTGNWPSVHIFSLPHAGHPCVSPKIMCSKILLPKFTKVLFERSTSLSATEVLLHGPWS